MEIYIWSSINNLPRQGRAGHEGGGGRGGPDSWWPPLSRVPRKVREEFHRTRKLWEPVNKFCLLQVWCTMIYFLQYHFRVTWYWMATAQNLPQGRAEENSRLDPGWVLSKRLEALNSMGNLLKIHLWMRGNFLWLPINFWVLLSICCTKFLEKILMKVSPLKVTFTMLMIENIKHSPFCHSCDSFYIRLSYFLHCLENLVMIYAF